MMITRQTLASKIDHTLLRPEATEKDIIQLCHEARENGLFSVCVQGSRLPIARTELAQSSVKLCSVLGFPTGASLSLAKADEAKRLCDAGVHEIDMVMNIGALKDRHEITVIEDIEAVMRASDGIPIKVIIETALLTESEKIKASECVVKAGATFIKTSTGFLGGGATVEDILLIKKHVGFACQIKASGGIQSAAQALELLRAGADRLGLSQSIKILNELENSK
jgi:deoxyribose-phosphate aldolase